jgi:hypothetical protein
MKSMEINEWGPFNQRKLINEARSQSQKTGFAILQLYDLFIKTRKKVRTREKKTKVEGLQCREQMNAMNKLKE